ncbi:MAG TPA: (d)CMP kinase [Thermoanaerobaculia bacterium]|nr:(d)CMP kinase [Thermoanaerobaculia bacterium]
MSEPLIVAIDGPSGAGKSTVARALAARLGVPYIDTGAMYRAVGLAAREAGMSLPLEDPKAVVALAETGRIGLEPSPEGLRTSWNGRDVTEAIRQPEISLYASAVSAIPGVRRRLVAEQQRLGRERGGVLEGRDIGTRVFPETPHKFFLTASPEARAQRRARELGERGTPRPYGQVLEEMVRRDSDDSTRADSPLTLDGRYTVIDSTEKDASQVVSEIEARVRQGGKLTGAGRAT